MRRITFALAGLLLTAAAAPALAADGWYVGLGAGWDDQGDTNIALLRPPFESGSVSSNNGAIFAGSLGFKFSDIPLRFEFESGYDWHSVNSFTYAGAGYSVTGHHDIASELVNAIYDFPVGPGWNLYAGAGIGAGHVDFETNLTATGEPVADVDHFALMWQLIGGASFEIAPNTDLFVDYRYRDARARDTVYAPSFGGILDSGSVSENVVMAGVRFYFFPAYPEGPTP